MSNYKKPVIALNPLINTDTSSGIRHILRQEKKYLLTLSAFHKLDHMLDQVMRADPHNGALGYSVRSLYFDTPHDRDFYEKEDGLELRRKVRLRIYNPNDDFALLELKQKQGEYQLKRSLSVSRQDAIKLSEGDYECLLNYKDSFAAEMYGLMTLHHYEPKVIVEYLRKAFIADSNNTRITFDQKIRSTETNMYLYDENLAMNPVFDDFNVVLEVKFNGFLLGYVEDMIRSCDRSQTSISKYILSRRYSMGM